VFCKTLQSRPDARHEGKQRPPARREPAQPTACAPTATTTATTTWPLDQVYKGLWRGTVVAVKTMLLPAELSGTEKREKMAVMETAISSSLSHPNVRGRGGFVCWGSAAARGPASVTLLGPARRGARACVGSRHPTSVPNHQTQNGPKTDPRQTPKQTQNHSQTGPKANPKMKPQQTHKRTQNKSQKTKPKQPP
jgi:hypothetical protein